MAKPSTLGVTKIMRKLLLLLLIISFLSCSDLRELNDEIYKAQKEQIQQSPYESASRMSARIEFQRRFRSKELPELLKEKLFQQIELTDTLLILEDFDEICFNCASERMQVLYHDTVYFIERELKGNRVSYSGKKVKFDFSLNDGYQYHDYYELVEVKNKMKRREDWISNPLEYGSDTCLDGNHTFLTALYPDGKIKTLYVRCWWPEFQRRQREK